MLQAVNSIITEISKHIHNTNTLNKTFLSIYFIGNDGELSIW